MAMFYGGLCFWTAICAGVGFSGIANPNNVGVLWMIVAFLWFGISGINIVDQWARRPVLRLGKYRGEIGPGFVWLNPMIEWPLDDVLTLDCVTTVEIKNVQTLDNVPLAFMLVLTTRIKDVRASVVEVEDVDDAIEMRAVAAASATIRAHDLGDILGEGLSFSAQILQLMREKVASWGVEVVAVEVKDFYISDEAIQQAISMKARAKKEAEAELARAEMQKQIAEQLNEAAHTLNTDGWRLKSMEVLLELCRSANNNTIIIPSELQALAQAFSVPQQAA